MIRKAVEADVPQLAELARQLHEHHMLTDPESYKMPFEQYFELEMQSFTEDEDITVFVSEQGSMLTSYAAFRITERDRAERTPARILYIEHFAVSDNCRRSGEGTALFEVIKDYAREQGCDLIQLGASVNNTDALGFYEAMGMKPVVYKMNLKIN